MRDTKEQRNALKTQWRDGDNAGDGYEIGEDEDEESINDISELGELVLARSQDTDIAVYRTPQGKLVGVGYVHGLWAVDLTQETP